MGTKGVMLEVLLVYYFLAGVLRMDLKNWLYFAGVFPKAYDFFLEGLLMFLWCLTCRKFGSRPNKRNSELRSMKCASASMVSSKAED